MNLNQVGYETDALREKAQRLAEALDFAVDKDACSCLYVGVNQLALKMPNFLPMSADFSAFTWAKRASEGKKQGLVKAVKPGKQVKIIDATAGWGRDAAILASLGAEVLMLERNVVMAALLEDALLHQSDKDRERLRLSLWKGNAHSFLNQLDPQEYPDVIYIDPMHPERNKSALVKKDLQALQQMIGADVDALDLITLARTRVKQRVVVKWPQKTKPLLPPDASIEGKTVRFDIYLRVKQA
jgi:16S rRNA (guanine1516-N2)-methyltransferase